MAGLYTLKIHTSFAAAHSLTGYPGACRNLHGHNWKVEIAVSARQLDTIGMAVDFKTLKHAANTVADRLDHQYLNDIPPFDQQNPTAENLAAYFYREVASLINNAQVHVCAVTLWETESACVQYTEIEGE